MRFKRTDPRRFQSRYIGVGFIVGGVFGLLFLGAHPIPFAWIVLGGIIASFRPRPIKCLLGRHEWKAEIRAGFKSKEKGGVLEERYREAMALSQVRPPDFIMPMPKCIRCDYVPTKILIAQMKAWAEYAEGGGDEETEPL